METTAKELARTALDAIDAALASGEIDEHTAAMRRNAIALIMSVTN